MSRKPLGNQKKVPERVSEPISVSQDTGIFITILILIIGWINGFVLWIDESGSEYLFENLRQHTCTIQKPHTQ